MERLLRALQERRPDLQRLHPSRLSLSLPLPPNARRRPARRVVLMAAAVVAVAAAATVTAVATAAAAATVSAVTDPAVIVLTIASTAARRPAERLGVTLLLIPLRAPLTPPLTPLARPRTRTPPHDVKSSACSAFDSFDCLCHRIDFNTIAQQLKFKYFFLPAKFVGKFVIFAGKLLKRK